MSQKVHYRLTVVKDGKKLYVPAIRDKKKHDEMMRLIELCVGNEMQFPPKLTSYLDALFAECPDLTAVYVQIMSLPDAWVFCENLGPSGDGFASDCICDQILELSKSFSDFAFCLHINYVDYGTCEELCAKNGQWIEQS